jgi:hypothetical protein
VTEAYPLDAPTPAQIALIKAAGSAAAFVQTLHAGTELWRVLEADSPELASQYAAVTYPSLKSNRFTPIHRDGTVIPAAYAGSSDRVTLWETILRGARHDGLKRVPAWATRKRYLVKVIVKDPLQMVQLVRPHITRLAAPGSRPPDLSAAWRSAYPCTRAWSQALFDHVPGIDGLRYESHMLPEDCYVVYGNPSTAFFEVTDGPFKVREGWPRELLLSEAALAGIAIDFEDHED